MSYTGPVTRPSPAARVVHTRPSADAYKVHTRPSAALRQRLEVMGLTVRKAAPPEPEVLVYVVEVERPLTTHFTEGGAPILPADWGR